ncbi:glucose 1-dehydrogenase [Vitiosangium sp. GDMCC 1.1324]|uniref:glucose 1-dehydrogenase n=1 Tax=Vitiosangium sp. (strain GDMCC 1.1324) TaxID=2138576 RepID=UPI000D33518E|nr:glucose 1-dehydrogenase [Vitiosangium sp. GDMCC 1.1324]PTL77033.1 glucose dehydrogenase [Vitiosangium sp. GDMCC 1.1324]
MKAVAVFPKGREVKVIDVPEPRLRSPTQVRVRTLEVGVCGTDKEVVEGRHGKPPEGEEHLILGHECLGEVVEVGEQVKGLEPGDLVVPRVRRPCPSRECRACRAGAPDFCVTGEYTERGIQGAHGFAAELFVEDASYLHPVPRELREVAVLTEPLTIAEKALREVERVQARMPWRRQPGRAVVLGAGPVGLLGAMVLMRAGYQTTVYSRSPKPNPKAEMAESLGAPYISAKQHPVEKLVEERGRADVVYEAAGVASAAFEVVKALAPNGVFVFTGVTESEKAQLDEGLLMKQMVLENQVLLGTVNAAAADFEIALEDLGHFRSKWPGRVERLISARHQPEDYAEVVRGEKGTDIKDIIVFTRG